MYILGIESTCDETAAAVVEDGRRLVSNVVATSVAEQALYGGVVPEIASRRHIEYISATVQAALDEAKLSPADLDGIAVSFAPGLIGAVLVGVNFAKGLSYAAKKPLIPVHHLRGHIASNYLSSPGLEPPFLCLVASGGHSHIVWVEDYTRLRILGRTRDDAAGEAFDKAARAMGIPYPGGVELDKIAEEGDENAYKLPHPHVDGAPLDFSFSGLKTAVLNLLNNARQKGEQVSVPDLCASYRKAVVDCLIHNLFLAAEETGARRIALAGGVSANRLLRRRAQAVCKEKGLPLYLPDLSLCGDNAAMIASQGYYEFLAGNVAGMDLNACAQRSIEE